MVPEAELADCSGIWGRVELHISYRNIYHKLMFSVFPVSLKLSCKDDWKHAVLKPCDIKCSCITSYSIYTSYYCYHVVKTSFNIFDSLLQFCVLCHLQIRANKKKKKLSNSPSSRCLRDLKCFNVPLENDCSTNI